MMNLFPEPKATMFHDKKVENLFTAKSHCLRSGFFESLFKIPMHETSLYFL